MWVPSENEAGSAITEIEAASGTVIRAIHVESEPEETVYFGRDPCLGK